MKKRGFTDRLYLVNLCLTWIFTVVCILLTIFSGLLSLSDLSVISYGLPVVWGELSIHTGFIIWKAKAENMSKFKQKENITM